MGQEQKNLQKGDEIHRFTFQQCCGKVDVPGVRGSVDSPGLSGPLQISEDDKHVHFRWRSTINWH